MPEPVLSIPAKLGAFAVTRAPGGEAVFYGQDPLVRSFSKFTRWTNSAEEMEQLRRLHGRRLRIEIHLEEEGADR